MKRIKRLTRKSIRSYKKRGFLAFLKNNLNYYTRNLLARKGKRKDLEIFYVDYFTPENSNFYWLKAFKKFGRVKIFDIVKDDLESFEKDVLKFKPDHIHLGGSVKNGLISPQILSKVREKLSCTVSAFYGDGPYSFYHFDLAKVADYVYLSNKTHIKKNQEKGLDNFKYMLCPTNSGVFNHQKHKKIYDIVFIGNNNRSERLLLLKKIAEKYNLKVFGNGWGGIELNCGDPVYGKNFSKVCNQAKICLGEKEPAGAKLEAYFSNRLVNTLATGSFYINPYSQNLESVFINKKHLVWYKNEEELVELIDYYLKHSDEREKIACQGQKEVYEKYTYEKSIKRILKDAGKI